MHKKRNGICSEFSSLVLHSHWKRLAEACQAPSDPLRPDLEIMESMAWFANKKMRETICFLLEGIYFQFFFFFFKDFFCFSVWGSFPCYLRHFGANISFFTSGMENFNTFQNQLVFSSFDPGSTCNPLPATLQQHAQEADTQDVHLSYYAGCNPCTV